MKTLEMYRMQLQKFLVKEALKITNSEFINFIEEILISRKFHTVRKLSSLRTQDPTVNNWCI